MKILDRYILKMFLINFIILVTVMMSLFVVIDMINDLDEFLDAGQIWARKQLVEEQAVVYGVDQLTLNDLVRERLTVEQLMHVFEMDHDDAESLLRDLEPSWLQFIIGVVYKSVDYYIPVLALLYIYLCGLMSVVAMGFTFSAMLRARELTAILASGVSLYRVALPVMLGGILVNSLTLPIQEYFIPEVATKIIRSKHEIKFEAIERFTMYLSPDNAGNLFSAMNFDAPRQMLEIVTVIERDAQGVGQRRITADQAFWEEDRRGWTLINGAAVHAQQAMAFEPEPVSFFPSELSPTVILARRDAAYARLLSLAELQELEDNQALDPDQRAAITQIIWVRFSLLVFSVLMMILGLPFFLLRSPGANLLAQSLKASVICLPAWSVAVMLLYAQIPMLNPITTAWLPVVIFLPVSAVLLQSVKS